MSALPEVTRLVPGDSNVEDSCATLSPGGGAKDQLTAPNEHTFAGRIPSTSSSTNRSPRTSKGVSVHIKEPPESETVPPASMMGPPTTDGVEHGPLHQAIPVMPVALAVTCCVLNILLPGIGLSVVHACFCSSTITSFKSNILNANFSYYITLHYITSVLFQALGPYTHNTHNTQTKNTYSTWTTQIKKLKVTIKCSMFLTML